MASALIVGSKGVLWLNHAIAVLPQCATPSVEVRLREGASREKKGTTKRAN